MNAGAPIMAAPAQSSADMAVGVAMLAHALAAVRGKPEAEVRGDAYRLAFKLADMGWEIRRLPVCRAP